MMRQIFLTCCAAIAAQALTQAHSGPPYPILSNARVGPLAVSLWTDPDATDDGSAAGQFWVVFAGDAGRAADLAAVRVAVAIAPLDRSGPRHEGVAGAVNGDPARRFVALPMDHEGPFRVQVTIGGPEAADTLTAQVDATYDLRPPRWLIAVYLLPFVLAGSLWAMLMRRRRQLWSARNVRR